MLTDIQIRDLAGRMSIPLEYIGFKDKVPRKLRTNRSYIINMEDALDRDGKVNKGSHWVCFQVAEYPNGVKEAIYFDSYGVGPPTDITKRVESNYKIGVHHTDRDIQSLMSDACGYYCLAFLHFINACPLRSRQIVKDADTFVSMYDDLEKSTDFKKNEWILKHFFMSKDPALRKAVEVITDDAVKLVQQHQTPEFEATL